MHPLILNKRLSLASNARPLHELPVPVRQPIAPTGACARIDSERSGASAAP